MVKKEELSYIQKHRMLRKRQKVIGVLNALDSAWRDERSMDLDDRYLLMKRKVARAVREIC